MIVIYISAQSSRVITVQFKKKKKRERDTNVINSALCLGAVQAIICQKAASCVCMVFISLHYL